MWQGSQDIFIYQSSQTYFLYQDPFTQPASKDLCKESRLRKEKQKDLKATQEIEWAGEKENQSRMISERKEKKHLVSREKVICVGSEQGGNDGRKQKR